MLGDPQANADAASGTVNALWQVQLCVIENNVIELIPSYIDWGSPVSATRASEKTMTRPSRAPSLALIETRPSTGLPRRGGDCPRLGSSALGDVRSPLKKHPGEGTGPTIDADLRGNLVGRVPPRGEPGVFQQTASVVSH